MRQRFPQRRRIAPPRRKDKDFLIEAPPELPRTVEPSAVKKALPWAFGLAMVAMVVMMFVMGFGQQRSPLYLFFMAMMAIALFQSMQQQGGNAELSTPEVNSERAEYLRYLSGKGEDIREAAAAQKAGAQWSHPDPDVLEAVVGSPRMWERGASDNDYLHIRVGRDEVKLLNKIKVKPVDSELDLEPVTKTALQHLRAVQQSIPHCPKTIAFDDFGMITVYGDRALFAAAARAWIAQLVCWHTPNDTALAVVSAHLESQWNWAKWLPHTESHDIDGAGPARFLGTSLREVEAMLEPLLKARAKIVDETGSVDSAAVTKSHKHVVLVVDDPAAAPAVVRRIAARDGVTVIAYRDTGGPDRDYTPHPRELVLRLHRDRRSADAPAQMDHWEAYRWQTFCAEPDLLDARVARHLARQLSKWDVAPTSRQDAESAAAHNMLSLLGVSNAAKLDVNTLWLPRMLPVGTGDPVDLEPLLRIPLGLQPSGAPLWLDLKDGADGGNGPHGLMIGMTGSGKSTALKAMAFGLFARHSPDVVQAILVDFKDGAGFDSFADYPHVVAVITNLEEKRSLVERFGETLFGLLDQRGRIFHETGNQIKGAAFESLREYNEVRATPAGAHLPPVPFMFVWVDEFSLLLKDHPDMADVFDTVTRKGRSQGVFFLFASQTLDEGVIKQIPNNTQYRIGLKVASESISRRVIGTGDAYHIADGKNAKGTGYFVRAPGAEPVMYRGFILPDRYEPPTTINRKVISAKPRARLFTAGRVEPDPDTVIEEEIAAESVIEGPPRSLVLTVGPQLAAAYGKQAPQLWSPPLDDPIPLDAMLKAADAVPARRGAAPWWPLGEIDRPRQLSHGLLTYSVDGGNVSILGMNKEEASMVVQTFILSAAARYSPRDIGFYVMAYGGSAIAAVKDLPHVGAVGGADRTELNLRIFGDLDNVIVRRRRLFEQHSIGSLAEFRHRRSQHEPGLDDGYPTDIFLIVDGWENFLDDNTSLMNPKNPHLKNVERLIGAGLGMHVLVSAADWLKFGNVVQSHINTRFELKLANNSQSQVKARVDDKMIRPQDRIPIDQPGRGINSVGDVIRFAVGRLDGKATMDELDAQVRETVAAIANRYEGQRPVPAPALLPARVDAATLGQDGLGGERYAIGVRGRDLRPLVVDFAAEPLLAVYGDDHHGKSTLITHLLRSVVARRSSPEQAIVLVFDKSRELSGETNRLIEGQDYYETNFATMAQRIEQLAVTLDGRTPPEDLGWEEKRAWKLQGPLIYLFVDDLDAIPAQVQIHDRLPAGGPPAPGGQGRLVQTWQPLLRHLANARDIGLRMVFTHRAAGISAVELSPTTVPGQFHAQSANRILLGSRAKSDKVGGVKFEEGLPPGRGFFLAAGDDNAGYVQLAAPTDAHPDGM
ncbi:type VII secretion protein EccCa [Mycobacterium xenopi]|uniref:type VII secretion protein EccCa n=1 Tax=Mycobacterium xenopi TaxID=1789 RepID=UPI000A155294|nr:type VII secretion protein EccCa [Mycobacterium xenopi]ORX14146.1 cell division protein FtsK [Mycobacterium xenopi]SPX94849.1 cell division protein FtsK [Mycobacterium xenopi]